MCVLIDNAKILIETQVSNRNRLKIYPVIDLAIKAYTEITNDYEFFNSNFFINLRGRLLTYLIFRQFESNALPYTFPYKTENVIVSPFGYRNLNIYNDRVIINIAKADNRNDLLPNLSMYRKNYSKNNIFNERQLLFDTNEKIVEEKLQYYVLITYKIINHKITKLNLVVPRPGMEGYLYSEDLINEYTMSKKNSTIIKPKKQEEIVAGLKQHLLERKMEDENTRQIK